MSSWAVLQGSSLLFTKTQGGGTSWVSTPVVISLALPRLKKSRCSHQLLHSYDPAAVTAAILLEMP